MAVKGRRNIQGEGDDGGAKRDVFCCPVNYGSMSPGDEFSNLGVIIPKGSKPGTISPKLAEHYFAGARCAVTFSIDANASPEGCYTEGMFGETADKVVQATCDVKSYRSSSKVIAAKLTFANEEVPAATLLEFRKQRGILQIERLGEIPAKAKKSDESQSNLDAE